MRRTLLIASAIAFGLASVADAQPGPPDQQNRPPQAGPHGGPHQGGPHGGPPGGPPGRPPANGGWQGGGRPPNPGGPPPYRPGPQRPPHRPPPAAPGYNSPNAWRSPRPSQWYWHGRWVGRVHAPPYRYPHGYGYRRWAAGAILPSIFLTDLYFYAGYGALGLPPPPYGAQWVRYGPDLVLVDLATGRIIDVAYGAFF